MRLPRVWFTVRCLIIAVAVLVGAAWAVRMAQKSRHYYQQAAIQARREAQHRQEEQRFRGRPVGSFGVAEFAEMEAEEANHHAHLRREYQRLATHPWESPPPDLPMPFPWDTDRDRQVIQVALQDLMDPQNPENAVTIPAHSGPGSEVVLAETTYASGDFGPSIPSERGQNSVGESWSDLVRRNSGGAVPLAGLALAGKTRVRYDDLERLYTTAIDKGMDFYGYLGQCYPKACGCVWATLPGYSRDGRMAVVFFAAGSSYHGEYWTYILQKTPTGWVVKRHEHDAKE